MLNDIQTTVSTLRREIRDFSQKWGTLTVSKLREC